MSLSIDLKDMVTNTAVTHTTIQDGDIYSWRIDDALDSGIVIYTDNSLIPVKPFTLATITFDNSATETMWVAEDNVVLLSKMGATKTYQHTLKLVELTKILEKIVITGLCLTPVDKASGTPMYANLKAQLTSAISKINKQEENITIVSAITDTEMDNAEPETFVYNNSTAREILDDIFSAIDSRVVVESVELDQYYGIILNINYLKMIPTTSVALSSNSHHTIISETSNNSVESYAGEIYSNIESALNDNPIRFQDTFKSNDAVATSNNRVMSLPYAIQYPIDFKLRSTGSNLKVKYTYYIGGDSSAHYGYLNYSSADMGWFDALDYFVDYEYWMVMALADQQKTLYYQRGTTEIDVSRTYKSLIVTKSVLNTLFDELIRGWYSNNQTQIMNDARSDAGAGTSIQVTAITVDTVTVGDMDAILYDISYIGEVEGLATSVKQDNRNHFERGLRIVDNQRANVIDIKRYGNNLKGKIDRLGNNQTYVDCDVDSYSNILPLLTKLTDYDNGIIYQVDIARHTDSETWYEVRYYLSKNYNDLSERIALKKEKRIYAIPPKGYQVILPDRETVVIDDERADHYSISLSGNKTIPNIAKAMLGNINQVRYAFVEVDNIIDNDPFAPYYDYFVLPVTAYGSGNTINFISKFYDNASAGLSVNTSGYGGINWFGGKKVCYNKYTNNYGWASDFMVDWGTFRYARTDTGIKAQPVRAGSHSVGDNSFTPSEEASTYFHSYYTQEKDPSEAICFQKIIRIEAARDSIILGSPFIEKNCLYQEGVGHIYIYYQNTDRDAYKQGDKKVRYDSSVDTKIMVTVSHAGTTDWTYYSYIYGNGLDGVGKYNIAIGDEDGNLYVARNGYYEGDKLFTFYKKERIG